MRMKKPRRTAVVLVPARFSKKGVAEGTRTPNPQNHNLMLYRLSYSHREDLKV